MRKHGLGLRVLSAISIGTGISVTSRSTGNHGGSRTRLQMWLRHFSRRSKTQKTFGYFLSELPRPDDMGHSSRQGTYHQILRGTFPISVRFAMAQSSRRGLSFGYLDRRTVEIPHNFSSRHFLRAFAFDRIFLRRIFSFRARMWRRFRRSRSAISTRLFERIFRFLGIFAFEHLEKHRSCTDRYFQSHFGAFCGCALRLHRHFRFGMSRNPVYLSI